MTSTKQTNRKRIKIEEYLKRNQNTISIIGIIISLGISIYSIALSIKNDKHAKIQDEINKQPIWKNTINNIEGFVKFESLKEGVVLQQIEIEFPSDYLQPDIEIKGDTWFTGNFQDRMLDLLQKYEHVHVNPLSSIIDNQDYIYPIAITY